MCNCQVDRIFYSINEVSYMLGLGRTFIYKLLEKGKLRAKKEEKRTMIFAESVAHYIQALDDWKSGPDPNPDNEDDDS